MPKMYLQRKYKENRTQKSLLIKRQVWFVFFCTISGSKFGIIPVSLIPSLYLSPYPSHLSFTLSLTLSLPLSLLLSLTPILPPISHPIPPLSFPYPSHLYKSFLSSSSSNTFILYPLPWILHKLYRFKGTVHNFNTQNKGSIFLNTQIKGNFIL